MLNMFPPGGAPPAINRQLPQNLSIPGMQQQAAGTPNPYQSPTTLGAAMGVPAQQSGLSAQLPMQMGTTMGGIPMGMPGAPGMLGQQPPMAPQGATQATPPGTNIPGLQGTPEGQMQSFAQALNPGGGY